MIDVEIIVSDEGPGINENDRKRLPLTSKCFKQVYYKIMSTVD